MRRRELVPILAIALVGVLLGVSAVTRAGVTGASSAALRIAVLVVIVAAILATRLGPRGR